MARFHAPAKRRNKRQVNNTAGATNKVPDELLYYEFGALRAINSNIIRPWSSVRLLRDGTDICLQVEDDTAGGETWMTVDEFKGLLLGLGVAAREMK